jgi:hypothetical protein
MKTGDVSLSINELAKLTKLDRRTISARLTDCPFEQVGAAHAYKLKDAMPALTKARSARERLAEVQAALLDIELGEKNRDILPTSVVLSFLREFEAITRSALQGWPIKESARIAFWNDVQFTIIEAMRACGADVSGAEKAHKAEIEKFKVDLAAGRIPDDWADTVQAENKCRVWSQDLGRYYTRDEIISKFGSGAHISPIDQILAEENLIPASTYEGKLL